MKRMMICFVVLSPALTFAQSYPMKGPIVGFWQGESSLCYIAIKDPSSRYYSKGYHYIDNAGVCALARAAYLTGSKVSAAAEVKPGSGGYTNRIKSLELAVDGGGAYWPPYGRG